MSDASGVTDDGSAASLAGQVLAEEARRLDAGRHTDEVVLPDDLLPGVGGEPMPLREALRIGGFTTVAALGFARLIEGFDAAAMGVLAPDIQDTLGVSDAVLAAIGSAFGVLFLVGSIPLSTLADRRPRKWIAAVSTVVWTVMVLLTGFVQTAFWLFMVRMGTGISQSHSLPVNGPLLMDTYPIPARGRVFALYGSFDASGRIIGPLFAGSVAGIIGGPESWRWVFVIVAVLGIPAVLGLAAIREPRRGRQEMNAVLGGELAEDAHELPISVSVAFERLKKIRTFYFLLVGMASLGFALFSVPLFLNLYLDDELGLSAWQRGLFVSAAAVPGVAGLALAGTRIDRLFRASPVRALLFVGTLIAGFGVFIVVGLYMPNVWLLGVFYAVGSAMATAAFVLIQPITASIVPYRLRSRGSAMLGVYVFVFGGFFGAVLTGLLSDAFGQRVALTIIVLPTTIVGGALISGGARHIRSDISRCVEELLEERSEVERVSAGTTDTPVVQVRNLDFSYGTVQVLFDVSIEVARGETLALLGTNGAGKSTLLRVISGLGVPSRGVVRLKGRTVTYTDPELRARIGIVQLMGGNAVFPGLSIDDNMAMAAFQYAGEDAERRITDALEMFPVLRERRSVSAGSLSGGQQQMLALAMALVHEPEVLIIDELSLGLAPVTVQEILKIVRRLQAEGMTMIIVEQSLNVALSIADRAVFMEKGQVRFDGSARELLERDDLARAVFLGDTSR